MRKLIIVLALAGALGCAGGRVSYTASAYGTTGYTPRVYYVDDYPGWLYVEGQYRYYNGQRNWHEGYWIRDRPTYVYSPGYYHPRTSVWVNGYWQPRGSRHHSYYRMEPGRRIYKAPPPRVRVRVNRPYY